MILKNGQILSGNDLIPSDIKIEDGIIKEIAENISGDNTIDVKGGWIIPGAVDVHAHLREPGFEHKGTIETETYAAAKGGITTVMAMPNTVPVPDDGASAKYIYDLIQEKSLVNTYLFGAVTKGQKGKKLAKIEEMLPYIKGLSDDGFGINNMKILKKAMLKAKEFDLVIASHAEDNKLPEPAAEYSAVQRETELAHQIGCKYHFCHLSTDESVRAIKRIRFVNNQITCEVTPHHLFLNEKCIGNNPNFKMNPPLRSIKDMKYTYRALVEGIATIVATDHAPHSEAEKSQEYSKAPNGVIGFETMLPLIYSGCVMMGRLSHKQMIEVVSENPAKRFNLPVSKLEVGSKTDIAVLDIENDKVFRKEDIVSKSKNSPFIGMSLRGWNMLTLVNGKVVYNAFNNTKVGGQDAR